MTKPRHQLDQVQRWMQSVLMHPGGVTEGVGSPAAREHIDISLEELPQVIQPSKALSSADRLEIYVNAYHARLMECLDEEFSVTRWAMGEELFAAVSFGYLQNHPSQSYTLGQLGARFPGYLAETRLHAAAMPEGAGEHWPQFIIELAMLERSLYEVYDGPGPERSGALRGEHLAGLAPESWADLRLQPAPSLRLHAFENDVSTFWARRKDGEEPAVEPPSDCWLAIGRRDYVVERHSLSAAQFTVLSSLVEGKTLGEALSFAAERHSAEEIEPHLGQWFAAWMEAQFFAPPAE
jgi:hypothetical protein